jgi:hypothetical protein
MKLSRANTLSIVSLLAVLIGAWMAKREQLVRVDTAVAAIKADIAEMKSFRQTLAQSMMNELGSKRR